MIDMEEWRAIPLYGDGLYEVSSQGRVRHGERILKTRKDRYGYERIPLRIDGKPVLPTIHALVAGSFIGPRPEGLEVAHVDCHKGNNRAENLIYATPSENRSHSIATGTIAQGARHGSAKLSADEVSAIRSTYVRGSSLHGCKPLARRYGVDPATIRKIVQGETWGFPSRARLALQENTP